VRRLPVAGIGLIVLLTTACGGVENEPNLAKAAERTQATGSSRLEVRAVLTDSGRQFALSCEGNADYDRKHLKLACNGEIGDMIALGDTAYFKSAAFGVRSDKTWIKTPLDETDSIHNFSPEKLLAMLRDASLQTDQVGEEAVRDVSTVRYRLTVHCEKAQLGCPGDTAPVDVWVDDEGLVRRIELEDDGSPTTIEFFDFGIEVEIEAPPADEVQELGAGWGGYGPPQDPNSASCSEREATPISESRALEALHRHGFSVLTERSGHCLTGVAAVISNAHRADALEREGILDCFLGEQHEDGAPKTVLRSGVDGGDAQLRLANLTCSILADSPNAEEKIRPLEQAFEELERAIRP
jgi:hypothetical protein